MSDDSEFLRLISGESDNAEFTSFNELVAELEPLIISHPEAVVHHGKLPKLKSGEKADTVKVMLTLPSQLDAILNRFIGTRGLLPEFDTKQDFIRFCTIVGVSVSLRHVEDEKVVATYNQLMAQQNAMDKLQSQEHDLEFYKKMREASGNESLSRSAKRELMMSIEAVHLSDPELDAQLHGLYWGSLDQ